MADREKPGAGDYVWLAYSIFFFIEPIIRNNRLYWLKSSLIYALFLVFYIASVRAPQNSDKTRPSGGDGPSRH